MDYEEARKYLESLYKFGSVLGLNRMKVLMEALGDPQDDLKYIHLAGTNGKGSTAAACARVLEEAGLSVGLYISPYLEQFEERISINGVPIDKSSVARLMERIRGAVEIACRTCGESPTEFEVVTALGFTYFAEKRVDVVCLEVGLGGRFDATNVIKKPEVATITPIGFDHMDRLGRTLDKIAFEKAGIIKEGVTVVSAPQKSEASRVIEEVCDRNGSHLYLGNRDFSWQEISSGLDGQRFDFRGPFGDISDLYFPLLGRHQQENAATAVMTVQAFAAAAADRPDGRVHLSPDTIRRGLAKVVWPGRLEVVRESPTVLLDVAHNEDGAKVLSRAIRDLFGGRRIHLVIGLLKDKDVRGFLANLLPLASSVVAS
ncbi:MAG TPA: bifunctional folylpolyglutamate synthase/dihydrofolate synthase, partial [Clostridia bacterium]|nr:bifunctional folylpolyglutamate synthase/dihydrofolate synthase [Clostridia bacterium]